MKDSARLTRRADARSRLPRVALPPLLGVAVACVLLTSCGGSHPALASRAPTVQGSSTRSFSPTRTTQPPSATEAATPSSATSRAVPTRTEPAPSTAVATHAESRTPTTASTPVRTSSAQGPAPSSSPPPTRSPTASPTASPTPAAAQSDGTGGTPAWVWWVLAAVGLGLAITIVAIAVRHHRRQVWARGFDDARAEVRWVAGTLVPQLALAPSAAQMMQDWQPASVRVMAAEDQLARLETTAPDAPRAARVRALREALVSSRVGVNDLVSSPDVTVARTGLTTIANALGAAVTRASGEQPPAAAAG